MTHDGWLRLTQKQLQCLADAWNGAIGPWDYGSSTTSSLKRLGYIAGRKAARGTVYEITAAGRVALLEDGSDVSSAVCG